MKFAEQVAAAHAAGFRMAEADPAYVRLTQPEPGERVSPKLSERLHGPDPADPWALPAVEGAEAA